MPHTSQPRLRTAEFPSPLLPRIAERLARRMLLSAIIALVVMVLPFLILEERAIELAHEWDQLDAWGRFLLGFTAVAVFVLIPARAATWHWSSVSVRRAIEEQASSRRDWVAAPSQLDRDPVESRKGLRVCLWIYAVLCLLGGGPLFYLGLADLAASDAMEVLGVGGGLLAVGAVLALCAQRLRRGFQPRSPRKTWSDDQVAVTGHIRDAAAAQRTRRLPGRVRLARTMARVLLALQGGFVTLTALATTAGVVTRQPCRDCDPRSFGPDLEVVLDRFWLAVGALALLTAAILLVWGLAEVVAAALTRRELLRWLQQGRVDDVRPEEEVLLAAVDETGGPWARVGHHAALWTTGPLLGGAAWLVVGAAGHTAYADHPGIGTTLLSVGLVMLGLCVAATVIDEKSSPAVRNRIRQAWPVQEHSDKAADEVPAQSS